MIISFYNDSDQEIFTLTGASEIPRIGEHVCCIDKRNKINEFYKVVDICTNYTKGVLGFGLNSISILVDKLE